jgi:hypothetical protein
MILVIIHLSAKNKNKIVYGKLSEDIIAVVKYDYIPTSTNDQDFITYRC